jgi:hypothetical protein
MGFDLSSVGGSIRDALTNPSAAVAGGLGAAAGAAIGKLTGIGTQAGAIAGGIAGAAGLLNPAITRLAAIGANPGGANSTASNGGSPLVQFGGGFDRYGSSVSDWRVKVTLPPGSPIFAEAFSVYPTKGIMYRLNDDKGVVFPFTPALSMAHTARYESQSLVHSNYNFYNYLGSETGVISITADFAVQNQEDAHYLLGAIYFFRACTKMFYGSGAYVGNPPPVVVLSGYGRSVLPKTPCVVTSFTHSLPADIDYMVDTEVGAPNSEVNWLPTHTQLTLSLQPVVSRNKQSNFDLGKYAAGGLTDVGALGGFL